MYTLYLSLLITAGFRLRLLFLKEKFGQLLQGQFQILRLPLHTSQRLSEIRYESVLILIFAFVILQQLVAVVLKLRYHSLPKMSREKRMYFSKNPLRDPVKSQIIGMNAIHSAALSCFLPKQLRTVQKIHLISSFPAFENRLPYNLSALPALQLFCLKFRVWP